MINLKIQGALKIIHSPHIYDSNDSVPPESSGFADVYTLLRMITRIFSVWISPIDSFYGGAILRKRFRCVMQAAVMERVRTERGTTNSSVDPV